MSEEIFDEALAIAGDIENQLKFYIDIGLEDIGGSAFATGLTSDSTAPMSNDASHFDGAPDMRVSQTETKVRGDEPAASGPPPLEQKGLFGESPTLPHSRPSGVKSTLSVIESRDASLQAIREDIGDCQRCKLHEHRKTIVFGEGDPKAKLVFVGEGPGAEEDASGRPFVGRAGQLLDKIIVAIGLKREDVYIANIVKCRPPGNRTPERDEVETCEPFLSRQLAFIRPDVIVALGSPAFQCLLRTREPITRARGEWREWNGIKVMPTFHPAFLLRSPDKKREVWEDMKKVRDYLNTKSS
jgi:uracil-DNA glycosylase family 4